MNFNHYASWMALDMGLKIKRFALIIIIFNYLVDL